MFFRTDYNLFLDLSCTRISGQEVDSWPRQPDTERKPACPGLFLGWGSNLCHCGQKKEDMWIRKTGDCVRRSVFKIWAGHKLEVQSHQNIQGVTGRKFHFETTGVAWFLSILMARATFVRKSKDTLGWVDMYPKPCLLHHINKLEINVHLSLSHKNKHD